MKLNIIGVLFAAGVGLALASPAEAQDHVVNQSADKSELSALSRNNGPDGAVWGMPALFIAGFAAGYGVRSLVSSVRQRRALRSMYGSLTSDLSRRGSSAPRHPLKADNSHILSIVPRDDDGALQSPAAPTSRGGT